MIPKLKITVVATFLAVGFWFPAHAYTARLANEFQQAMKDSYQEELAAGTLEVDEQISSQQERIDRLGKCAVHREVMAGLKEKTCRACPGNLPPPEVLTQQSYAAASHYVYFVMALEDEFGVENVNADRLRRQLEDSWSALREELYKLYEEASLSTAETVKLNRLCVGVTDEVEASDKKIREKLESRSEPADGGHFYE